MTRCSLLGLVIALAACGGSGGDDPVVDAPKPGDAPGADAPPPIDAAPATVLAVDPCEGEAATVESTGGFRFNPAAVTINEGEIVKFISGSSHNVIPVFPNSDPGLTVGFGQTKCLRFTRAGTYNYRCQPHSSMTGTVTVN